MIKRPVITDEMILEAAREIAGNLSVEFNADEIAACYLPHMDGYNLARALDDLGGWGLKKSDVDELDELDGIVDDLLRAAEKKWGEENNIQPPLPVGTVIKQGVIHGVCSHTAARYLVKEHGRTREGVFLVIKFEDAEIARTPGDQLTCAAR